MVEVTSLPIVAESSLEFSFGVRALTEMKVWYTLVGYLTNQDA